MKMTLILVVSVVRVVIPRMRPVYMSVCSPLTTNPHPMRSSYPPDPRPYDEAPVLFNTPLHLEEETSPPPQGHTIKIIMVMGHGMGMV